MIRLPKAVSRELLLAVCLAPTLVAKLRAAPDLLITASDASHTGAGVSGTAGLTDYGVAFAESLPKGLPSEPPKGFAVVSLFSGYRRAATRA